MQSVSAILAALIRCTLFSKEKLCKKIIFLLKGEERELHGQLQKKDLRDTCTRTPSHILQHFAAAIYILFCSRTILLNFLMLNVTNFVTQLVEDYKILRRSALTIVAVILTRRRTTISGATCCINYNFTNCNGRGRVLFGYRTQHISTFHSLCAHYLETFCVVRR